MSFYCTEQHAHCPYVSLIDGSCRRNECALVIDDGSEDIDTSDIETDGEFNMRKYVNGLFGY